MRVLIADDHGIVRSGLRKLLESEDGIEVVAEAGDGVEACDRAVEFQPDLAILDVKMPGLDGITAAGEIASERLCAVVLLTAFSQRKLVESARDAGVMAYLVKPFQREELVPAIELAVGRFSELVALSRHAASMEEQLEVRKLTDRAKARLIADHEMSEELAFKFLQRASMDRRIPVRQVAEAVLAGELTP